MTSEDEPADHWLKGIALTLAKQQQILTCVASLSSRRPIPRKPGLRRQA